MRFSIDPLNFIYIFKQIWPFRTRRSSCLTLQTQSISAPNPTSNPLSCPSQHGLCVRSCTPRITGRGGARAPAGPHPRWSLSGPLNILPSLRRWALTHRVKLRNRIHGHDTIAILWVKHGIMLAINGRRFIMLFRCKLNHFGVRKYLRGY